MKKIIIPIVLLFAFNLSAQVKTGFGIKAGLNLANISNTNYDLKPDFYVGGLFSVKFSDSYTLQPELIYSRQGARQQLDGGSNPDIELDYLSIAVANKFKLFKNINLHAIVGPFVGQKSRDNIEGGTFSVFDDMDMGLFMGLSYELFSKFELEMRYKRGLTNIPRVNLSDYNHTHSNKVIQIGINYKFDFKN